jgi:N-acetylmuramoyl-L-alanine amidase
MRKIDWIVVHCTATPEGRPVSVKTITDWHVRGNGWRTIGYHHVIGINGEHWTTLPESQVGNHARGANANGIGVVYVGGLDKLAKNPKDTRTAAQKTTLRRLLAELKARYPNAEIIGHRDVPGTRKACPSFDAKAEYASL